MISLLKSGLHETIFLNIIFVKSVHFYMYESAMAGSLGLGCSTDMIPTWKRHENDMKSYERSHFLNFYQNLLQINRMQELADLRDLSKYEVILKFIFWPSNDENTNFSKNKNYSDRVFLFVELSARIHTVDSKLNLTFNDMFTLQIGQLKSHFAS